MSSRFPLVGIVLVHYRDASESLACIRSLRGLSYPARRLFVIDNNSIDRSGGLVRAKLQENEEYIFVPENRGFAAGANVGISQAIAHGASYVFLVNPDLEVLPETLDHLVAFGQRDRETGIIGPKVLYPATEDGTSRVWSMGGKIDLSEETMEMLQHGELEEVNSSAAPFECDYVPGCALLAKREVFKSIGLLPEDYFMYFEESDWCLKAGAAGFRLMIVPEGRVFHRFDNEKMQHPFVVYYYNRNRRIFWYRHGTLRQRMFLVLRTLFKELPQAAYAYFLAPDLRHRSVFKAHIQSCLDFLLARRGKRR